MLKYKKIKIVLFLLFFLCSQAQCMELAQLKPVTFMDLPYDIKNEICKELDLPLLYAFARTCKEHRKYCHNISTLTAGFSEWIKKKEPENVIRSFQANVWEGRYFFVKNFLLAGLDPNVILKQENGPLPLAPLGLVVLGMGFSTENIEEAPLEHTKNGIVDYAKTMKILLNSKRIDVNKATDGHTALSLLIAGMGIQKNFVYLEKDKGQALLSMLLEHGALFLVHGGPSLQNIKHIIAQIPEQEVKKKLENLFFREKLRNVCVSIACTIGVIMFIYYNYKLLRLYEYL